MKNNHYVIIKQEKMKKQQQLKTIAKWMALYLLIGSMILGMIYLWAILDNILNDLNI